MSYLESKLVVRTERKNTHVEWLRFLKQVHREIPKELTVHIIADNGNLHKRPKAWLQRHTRIRMHFTPTASSWLHRVEQFFVNLKEGRIRTGSLTSAEELTDSITNYLAGSDKHPRPYQWIASGQEILAKIHCARQALAGIPANQH